MNTGYSFERFVVVASNRAAFQAAVAFSAGDEGKVLVFDGDTPRGKTHLLHSLGRKAGHPVVVRIMTGELVYRYITARLTRRSIPSRCADDANLLLIDDLHFLMGKTTAQQLAAVETVTFVRRGGRVAITCADFKRDLPHYARALRETGVSPEVRRIRRPTAMETLDIVKAHFAAEEPLVDIRAIRAAVAAAGPNVRRAIGLVVGDIARQQIGNARTETGVGDPSEGIR